VKQTVITTTWPSLIVLHYITPSLPLHRLTAWPSGPANDTQRGSSTAPHHLYAAKNKGQGTKNTSHAIDTDNHTWRRHHLTHVSTKAVSYPSTPLPVSTHNNPLLIHSIWFTEQTLSLREQTHRVTLPESRKLTFQPTTPPDFRNSAPLPPHGPLFITR